MTIDAKQQLNAVSRGDSPRIYRHPKSGATALHVASAKGYINVIRLVFLQVCFSIDWGIIDLFRSVLLQTGS